MKQFFLSIPKTSVAAIVGAVIVYLQAKTVIDGDTAVFLSSILAALGIGSNVAISRMRK